MAATSLYRHFDAEGSLLYVGIAANPFQRARGHTYTSAWMSKVIRIEIEHFETWAAARKAELLAIAIESPKFNLSRPKVDEHELRAFKAMMRARESLESKSKALPAIEIKEPGNLEELRRLRVREVMKLTGWSRPTLYRRCREGLFPNPRRDIGVSYWPATEVTAYLTGANKC